MNSEEHSHSNEMTAIHDDNSSNHHTNNDSPRTGLLNHQANTNYGTYKV
jgi:hypothetical protein